MSTKRSERDPETHRLTTKLTPAEREMLRVQLSAAVDTLRRAEDEKKTISKQLADKVDAAKKAVCDLNDETETGYGVRDVVCTWDIENNGPSGRREWVCRRSDTGDIYQTQPLGADDLQETLFS